MRLPWEPTSAWHTRLASRAASGDRTAFQALYRALYPPVARFVGRRVRSPADAEDLVSRTFHRLLETLGRIDPARGAPLAYALTLARSAVADHRRAARPAGGEEALAGLADGAPDPHAALEREESLRAVAALLAGLPAETRDLLELRFGDGLRHAEIAALTGASEAAVKQRVSRALRELRAALACPARGAEEVAS